MASQLEYPDDDLDAMLDDELEIMRDLEKENYPGSPPPPGTHTQARKSLEFGVRASTGGMKVCEGNVGIGGGDSVVGKRQRSEGEDWEDDPCWNTVEDEAEMIKRSERTPGAKRFKSGENVLSELSGNSGVRIRIPRLGERKVYRKIPDGEFQAVTSSDGSRFYLRKVEESKKIVGVDKSGQAMGTVGLCGMPFHKLTQLAQGEMNRLATAAVTREGEDSGVESGEEDAQTELWVEKFRPRSYMDLLSDDGTNRTLLMWLKLWDKLVFNKERKVKPKKEEEDEKAKFTSSSLPEVQEEIDSVGRPVQRIALLHGPPGLGKTTLAHIVARHAGYKVVEMNASDDRSVEAFQKKLESSTQMRSVVTDDQRPNCLVIDEIDGAPAVTINYLVAAINGVQKEKKKKGGGKGHILRPIICICNELYTPALRPLRQLALIVPFPPTLPTRLAGRLKEITATEKLKTDLSALLALCKKTDNDIRSCLSTLQFFRKRGKQLRAVDLANTNLGSKDSQRSLFSVWDDLFTIPRADKVETVYELGAADKKEAANTVGSRFRSILSTVQSCGEYDRLMQGVFENYLNIKFKDCNMIRVGKGLEWFSHFDVLNKEMLHGQVWALMGHFPYALVAAHLLFGSNTKQRINFPTQETEAKNNLLKSQNVLASVVGEMLPSARVYSTNTALVRELLPAILSVVQPTLRPVNTQLFSAKEKSELANVVSVHIAYNLTYQQERDLETGQYVYKMDPDVESVVCFPGTKRLVNLTYGIKQLIAHEIELEKMRRIDAAIAASREGSRSSQPQQPRSAPTSAKNTPIKGLEVELTPKGSKKTTSHLQKLSAKPMEIKERVATDFFGRAIKVDPDKLLKKKENEIVKSDIWFKFKEGYSNAVRRNLKMKELM